MLDGKGLSIGIWGISLTSFTCMFTVVTIKLVIWTRWWTKINFFFYGFMSILVYVLYMWVCERFGWSIDIRESVVPLHGSPLFWLTILLIGGTTFLGDIFIEWYRMTYYANGSDYVRLLMKEKKGDGWNDLTKDVTITDDDLRRIDEFMAPIHSYYREQDQLR